MSRIDDIKFNLNANVYAYGGEGIAQEDVAYLLAEVQRLTEALDESGTECRNLHNTNSELLLALNDINVCCPDPETLIYDTEGGKEDYAEALIHVRSFL